ncbi:hypothetical protein JCM5350_003451 [Sporobolomyces pararoseus]
MSSNGYPPFGGNQHHHPSPHSTNSAQNSTYSMPPLQPGVPLLSTGPLGGPSTSNSTPGMHHGLPSLHQSFPPQTPNSQSHHPLSFYNDPYSAPYTPTLQQQPHQHHYTPQYVPRPISAASNHHSPAPTNSSVIASGSTHSQPSMQPQTPAGLPTAADSSSRANTVGTGTESPPPPPPPVAKARSSVACALCRKQKMKCEGPDKKPCRRCRAAGVECVFEAPPVTTPKPRGNKDGVTEAWVDAKLSVIDSRISVLEENSNSSVARQSTEATTSDHERRIAALEAQIYALQLQAAQAPASRPTQLDFPHHQQTSFGNNSFGLASPSNGHSLPPFQPGSNMSLHNRYNSGSSLKHEVDSSGGGGAASYATDSGLGEYPSAKRWKGDVSGGGGGAGILSANRPEESFCDRPDFISRGVVTEEEAAMCYDSYFLTFAANTPHSEQRTLTFSETRRRSPLYLATIVSIGARSLSRVETFHVALREALYIASEMFMPDDDGSRLITTLTLKSFALLGLYYSLPHHLLASGMLGYKVGLRSALDDFSEVSEEDQKGKIGRTLVGKGRMMLVVYLWCAFYTYQAGESTCYDVPIEVLRRQLDILANSPYAEPIVDNVLRTNLELCGILHAAFRKLGDGMVVQKLTDEELWSNVDQSITEMIQWNARRADTMVNVSQWGDSQELKAILPFHHGRQCVLRYIFHPETPLSGYDRNNPRLRDYAKMAMESAVVILRWGVESRIWMPFSIVGGYVHNINIPAALQMLFVGARLFPADAEFNVIRPLLHRLVKQCDVTIRGVASTKKEVHRAELTKAEVLEFDRFAFESSGEESFTPPGDDQPGLVGNEIGQSLASFRLELNLWSSPLRCFEEDTF